MTNKLTTSSIACLKYPSQVGSSLPLLAPSLRISILSPAPRLTLPLPQGTSSLPVRCVVVVKELRQGLQTLWRTGEARKGIPEFLLVSTLSISSILPVATRNLTQEDLLCFPRRMTNDFPEDQPLRPLHIRLYLRAGGSIDISGYIAAIWTYNTGHPRQLTLPKYGFIGVRARHVEIQMNEGANFHLHGQGIVDIQVLGEY